MKETIYEPMLVNPVANGNPWGYEDFALGNPRRRKGRKGASKKLRSVMKKATSLRRRGLSAAAALKAAWKGVKKRSNPGEILMVNKHKRRRNKRRKNPVNAFYPNRKRRGNKKRRNPVNAFYPNRKRRRNRRRRNPAAAFGLAGFKVPALMPLVKNAAWGAAGAVATDIGSDWLMSRWPQLASSRMMHHATKAGVAVALGAIVGKFLGKEKGAVVAVGGLIPVAIDLYSQARGSLPLLARSTPSVPSAAALGFSGGGGTGLGSFAPLNGGSDLGAYAPLMA